MGLGEEGCEWLAAPEFVWGWRSRLEKKILSWASMADTLVDAIQGKLLQASGISLLLGEY